MTYGRKLVNRNLSITEWNELVHGLAYERTCPELPSGHSAPTEAPVAHY
jgi:hypothetical protein